MFPFPVLPRASYSSPLSVVEMEACLEVHHSTVYRTLERWKEKGFEGLSDVTPAATAGGARRPSR
jgi:transposase